MKENGKRILPGKIMQDLESFFWISGTISRFNKGTFMDWKNG